MAEPACQDAPPALADAHDLCHPPHIGFVEPRFWLRYRGALLSLTLGATLIEAYGRKAHATVAEIVAWGVCAAGLAYTERDPALGPPRPSWGFAVFAVAELVVAGGLLTFLSSRFVQAPNASVACVALVVAAHWCGRSVLWHEPFYRYVAVAVALCSAPGLAIHAAGGPDSGVAVVAGVLPGFVLQATALYGMRRIP